jgi:hypothetical protein
MQDRRSNNNGVTCGIQAAGLGSHIPNRSSALFRSSWPESRKSRASEAELLNRQLFNFPLLSPQSFPLFLPSLFCFPSSRPFTLSFWDATCAYHSRRIPVNCLVLSSLFPIAPPTPPPLRPISVNLERPRTTQLLLPWRKSVAPQAITSAIKTLLAVPEVPLRRMIQAPWILFANTRARLRIG